MTALLALGLGLMAVFYSVWPVLGRASRRRLTFAAAETPVDSVASVAAVARAWSSAAGEIEATAEAGVKPGTGELRMDTGNGH